MTERIAEGGMGMSEVEKLAEQANRLIHEQVEERCKEWIAKSHGVDFANELEISLKDGIFLREQLADRDREIERLKVWSSDSHIQDVDAENKKLRDENERLKASQCPSACYPTTTGGCDLIRELEKLRAGNEWLNTKLFVAESEINREKAVAAKAIESQDRAIGELGQERLAAQALQAQVAEMRKALGNLAFKGHCFCTTDKIPDDLHAAYCVNARAALALTPTTALERWKAMEKVVEAARLFANTARGVIQTSERESALVKALDALDGKPPAKD